MKRREIYKVLCVSHNPGGFQAIIPVYQRLKKNSHVRIEAIFVEEARTVSSAKNLRFVSAATANKRYVQRIFSTFHPQVLLCGTSGNMSTVSVDKIATVFAREYSVPSLAVIDGWSDYAMRFSDPGTNNMRYLTEWVLVTDTQAKQRAVKEGIPSDRILITGNPHFDTLRLVKSMKDSSRHVISFIDQPFSEVRANVSFNEVSVFRDIVHALESIGVDSRVIIKLHPRSQKKDKYNKVIAKSTLDITIDETVSIERLLGMSSIVVGMHSMVLFDAAMLSRNVLSYQPGCSDAEDLLPTNRWGISVGVYRKKDLQKALQAMVEGKLRPRSKKKDMYLAGHATDNVLGVLWNVLGVSSLKNTHR